MLVTGGAGFIGSHVVSGLVDQAYVVHVVDDLSSGKRANIPHDVSLHQIDVRADELAEIFASVRPEFVIHLAAQIDVRLSVRDPIRDAAVNILGTLNVLERSREIGVSKVVIASSGGCVYGDEAEPPLREDAPGRPASPYGISKRVLHDYLDFYRAVHGLDSAVLALSNVFGPRQDPHGEAGVVAIFIKAMLEGRPTTIFGDGSQTRDFVVVADVADAFVKAVDRGSGVYNVGTGRETSVMDLWRACAQVTGYEGSPSHAPPRPGELQRNALDASRARRDLGWEPRVDLLDGLKATAEHIAATVL